MIRALVFGGAEGDRTPDLCIANAALSQLSYSPKVEGADCIGRKHRAPARERVIGQLRAGTGACG